MTRMLVLSYLDPSRDSAQQSQALDAGRPAVLQLSRLDERASQAEGDVEPTQGEPTQTNRDYWGPSWAIRGLFGAAAYSTLLGSPWVGSESLYEYEGDP